MVDYVNFAEKAWSVCQKIPAWHDQFKKMYKKYEPLMQDLKRIYIEYGKKLARGVNNITDTGECQMKCVNAT